MDGRRTDVDGNKASLRKVHVLGMLVEDVILFKDSSRSRKNEAHRHSEDCKILNGGW